MLIRAESSINVTERGNVFVYAVSNKWVGWTSLFFAILQSVCTLFVALSGLRILLGGVALAAAVGALKLADTTIHLDVIRIPMLIIACLGASFNLIALWQVRRLRQRPASAWRRTSQTLAKISSQYLQLGLALTTLFLLAVETFYHYRFTSHL
jgi:hypothetical protein